MKSHAAQIAVLSAVSVSVSIGLCAVTVLTDRSAVGDHWFVPGFYAFSFFFFGGILGFILAFVVAINDGIRSYHEAQQRLQVPLPVHPPAAIKSNQTAEPE